MSGGRPPKPCIACRTRPVAWTTPRVDYCYRCLPGGPFEPPPCGRCGGASAHLGYEYYSQGLCARCHNAAPQRMEACRDCLAWGVIRKYKWLCWRCRRWRRRPPRRRCRICQRDDVSVTDGQVCNLCDRQMVIHLRTTVEQANMHGQQLYLANIAWPATRPLAGNVRGAAKPSTRRRDRGRNAVEFYPVEQIQLALFDMPRDLAAARATGPWPDPPDAQMAAFLDAAVTDHARRHGWSTSTVKRTRLAIRVLQLMQDTPGSMLLASDAMRLQEIGLTAVPVIDVATAAGVMLDDRQPAIHAWFATTIAELPAPMRTELAEWFDVMLNGSTNPPRRRARDQTTVRLHLR